MKSNKKIIITSMVLIVIILMSGVFGVIGVNAQPQPIFEPLEPYDPNENVPNPPGPNPFNNPNPPLNINPNPNTPQYTATADPQACGQGFGDNFKCAVDYILSLLNLLVPLLIGIAVILFLFGLVKYITAGGDETKVKEAKKFILFGIVGLFVMVSVWGLVQVLVNSFFPEGGFYVPQIKS